MALDSRKHVVPSGTDATRREAINELGASISDIVPVTDISERAAVASAASPSVSRPLYVSRANADPHLRTEYTTDGTTWYALQAEDDTGWVYLTTSVNVLPYTGSPGTELAIRRIGGMVEIAGALSPATATDAYYVGTAAGISIINAPLPEAFRPSGFSRVVVSQGSSDNRFALRINTDGTIFAQRYGPAAATTTTWLPIAAMWMRG